MSRDPEALLTQLLVMYWHDGVSQTQAANLLGIRKEDFAELADWRLGEMALERAAWTYYVAQFHYRFPECDRHATHRDHGPTWNREPRMFTDDELLSATEIGNWQSLLSTKIEVGNSPPAIPRALPATWQQSSIEEAA